MIIPTGYLENPSYYVADFQPHTNGKAGNWKRCVTLLTIAISREELPDIQDQE
jgi:hypothetical protein